MSWQSLLVMLVVVVLSPVCLARRQKERMYPRNITACDSSPSGIDGFSWDLYRGRWYVSRITTPLGPSLRDISGYAVDIDYSSIEPNARDRAWREATVDRREILVNGDSRNCRKRKWQCVREQGTSRITCMLNGNGGGVIMQRSEVIAINYFSTAVVYKETFINGRFLSKQINLLVRDPNAEPDPSVIQSALMDYCGIYAADPNSEFYKSFSNDSNLSCFLP